MKKIVTLLLAAGLVFSAVNSASAVEVKASGTMDFTFEAHQNINGGLSFMDNEDARRNSGGLFNLHQKHSGAVQRFRLGLDFIMDENLSAHYQAQVGTFTWGGPGGSGENMGGALGSRSANITTRLAYLDWMIPTTDVHVRMGQQPVAMPSFTFGSPVLDDTATGIVVSAPVTSNIGLTGFWVRGLSENRRGNTASLGVRTDDNLDLFGGIADFRYDGFAVSPWFILGSLGKDAASRVQGALTPVWSVPTNGNSFVWFAGIGGELTTFDPFRFTADFYYSALDGKHSREDRSGWYASLGVEYATAYGTPALKGWYASGDDKKESNGSEQPLTLAGGFNATSTYFDGRYSIANTIDRTDAAGTWGVSLQWNDLSFIEGLSHDASVTYIRGTNSRAAAAFVSNPVFYLSRKDALIEFDFDTTYMIYSNLATVLELSYIIEDFNKTDWGRNFGLVDEKAKFSDAWRAALNFRYTF